MKATIIPVILAATVIIAGIFALSPVDKVSTTHIDNVAIADSNVGVLSLEKTLPDGGGINPPGTAVTWTFSTNEDTIIRAIWIASDDSFCTTKFGIGNLEYRNSDDVLDGANNAFCDNLSDAEMTDFLHLWEQEVDVDQANNNVEAWSDYIPLEAGDNLVLTFTDNDNSSDFDNLTVWIAFQNGDGATLV